MVLRKFIGHPITYFSIFPIILLAMYFCGKIQFINHPLFTTASLIYGWLVVFITNKWNQEKTLINQMKHLGYQAIQQANMELNPQKQALSEKNQKVSEVFYNFIDDLRVKVISYTNLSDHPEEAPAIEQRANITKERCTDMATYLNDFRIELQNYSLGSIVGKTIPRRQPLDPRYKTPA